MNFLETRPTFFCRQNAFIFIALCIAAVISNGCSTFCISSQKNTQAGESVVLAGEQPARLAFVPIKKISDVRSTYRNGLTNTVHYEEGRDFLVDLKTGEIKRTAQSRIPNFQTNSLFGVNDFDHSHFPGFGNNGFFAFVDYTSKTKINWLEQKSQIEFLTKTKQKLENGQKLKIIAFGDSITAGGDATEPSLIFWQRWADDLQRKYPRAKVESVNGATGGDNTQQGLIRLDQKVLSQQPDLVLIGFGMNDHNIGGFGVPIPKFEDNLRSIVDQIRQKTGAEVILYSTFPPNPKWHYGSQNMVAYAAATEKVAREKQCAFADVFHNWQAISAQKKPEDMLSNNINHPNDFGHGVYFQVLNKLGL